MNNSKAHLVEGNGISLRTARVIELNGLVWFVLHPVDLTSRKPYDNSWTKEDNTWLYRNLRSPAGEQELANGVPCIDQLIRPLSFPAPPEFRLVWADSGHGVALLLNGEPWAFIDEASHRGYSKGILDERIGQRWDQERFEKLF